MKKKLVLLLSIIFVIYTMVFPIIHKIYMGNDRGGIKKINIARNHREDAPIETELEENLSSIENNKDDVWLDIEKGIYDALGDSVDRQVIEQQILKAKMQIHIEEIMDTISVD